MTSNSAIEVCPDPAELRALPIAANVRAHAERCEGCRLVVGAVEENRGPEDVCEQFEPLLAMLAGGTIDKVSMNLVTRHLASCEDCRVIAGTLAPTGDREGDHQNLPAVDPGDYALGLEVARGGMGRIIAARDLRVGRPVAVKELLEQSPQLAARFEREARVTARLQHPGILPVYEIGKWPDGTPFYSMRLVEGRTLRVALESAPTLARRLALLPSVIDACEAVAFAHNQHVIHRDLTPSNILVGGFGETVVIDWGLAKDLASEDIDPDPHELGTSDRLTNAGAIVGTLAYMPPEQANGEPADERSDVYALGAILYQLLAGVPPYRAHTAEELLCEVRTASPRAIDEAQPKSPRDLVSIVTKAMARDPAARYPTAHELADELERFQTGRMVEAHQYTQLERVQRFVGRNRGAVLIATLAVVVLSVLGSLALRNIFGSRESARATARELLFEKGRVELLAGNKLRALAYLDEASRQGKRGPELELLLAGALADLSRDPPLDCGSDDRFVAVSPDGNLLAGACSDRARLWRVRGTDGRPAQPILVATLTVDGGAFDELAFSHDGRWLATYGTDGIARLWRISDLSRPAFELLHAARSDITRGSFSPDDKVFATSGDDGYVRLWATETGAMIREIAANPMRDAIATGIPVTRVFGNLVVHEGHLRVVTLGFQGIGKGFDANTGAEVGVFDYGGLVAGGHVSTDGRHAVACGVDSVVKLIDLETGQLDAELVGHTDVVWKCTFSDDGQRVLTSSHDRTAKVWDVSTPRHPRLVATVDHGDLVWVGRFSPRANRFVTVSPGRSMKVWDTNSGALLASLPTRGKNAIFLSDDRLVALRGDGKLQIWEHLGTQRVSYGPPAGASIVGTTPDGGTAVVERDGLALVATATGLPIATRRSLGSPFATAPHRVAAVYLDAPSTDTASTAWGIAVVDVEHATTVELPIESAIAILLPSELQLAGDRLAITRPGRGVEIWSVQTGRRIAILPVAHARLDERGVRAIAWEDAPSQPAIWDLHEPARVLTTLAAVDARPIGFALDGLRVVLVESHATDVPIASVWNVETGRRLVQIPNAVSPTIDPSGRWLTSITAKQEVLVTDLVDGTPHTTFTLNTPLQHVQANPDGALLVAIGDYGRVVMVLAASDGRVLARYDIQHDPPMVRPSQFQVPASDAWWTPDGSSIASRAKGVAVWQASNPYPASTVAQLIEKNVPWRIDDGRLVVRNGVFGGRVLRRGEPVAGATIEVLARRPADVGDKPVTWESMKARLTRLETTTAADGTFEVEDISGELEYLVTASDSGSRSPQREVSIGPDDLPLDLELP